MSLWGTGEPVLLEGCTAFEARFLLEQVWRLKVWFQVLTVKSL